MRAALYRDMGDAAEVFHVEEVDRPEPGPGDVLVRVHASGINPTDYKARSGAVRRPILVATIMPCPALPARKRPMPRSLRPSP